MKPVRILIADDHEVIRRGVTALFGGIPEWEIVGEASNGADAVQQAERQRPDVVILDINMPELSGLEAISRILAILPHTEILVLTLDDSEETARQGLSAGARGYILKSDAALNIVNGVRSLCEHKTFFTSTISEMIFRGFLESRRPVQERLKHGLTDREREVVQLLAEGKCNKEVASILNISVKTVETHRRNVFSKLNFHSLSNLIHYAIRNHIIGDRGDGSLFKAGKGQTGFQDVSARLNEIRQ